jgi:ABC-type glycerol-3-phosphate transport system substrate-binding protein
MLFFNTLKELTGVELEVTLTQSKSYPQKLQMMIASKQIPDIFQDPCSRWIGKALQGTRYRFLR